jgi:serine/threonine protein kinase
MSSAVGIEQAIDRRVLEKYEFIRKIGRGFHGVVWTAKNKRTKKMVAIKHMYNCFQNNLDAQKTYREAMFLNKVISWLFPLFLIFKYECFSWIDHLFSLL